MSEVTEVSERALFACAYGITRDIHKAQDLVQDTRVRLMLKGDLYEEGNYVAWAKKMMFNIFLTQYRRETRRKSKNEERPLYIHLPNKVEETPLDTLLDREVDPRIIRALVDLQPKYRQAFMLHTQNYTTKEIAKILGCPDGTVMSRVHRAKDALRKALKDEVFI